MIEQFDRKETHINAHTFQSSVMLLCRNDNDRLTLMHDRNGFRMSYSACWLHFSQDDVDARMVRVARRQLLPQRHAFKTHVLAWQQQQQQAKLVE